MLDFLQSAVYAGLMFLVVCLVALIVYFILLGILYAGYVIIELFKFIFK